MPLWLLIVAGAAATAWWWKSGHPMPQLPFSIPGMPSGLPGGYTSNQPTTLPSPFAPNGPFPNQSVGFLPGTLSPPDVVLNPGQILAVSVPSGGKWIVSAAGDDFNAAQGATGTIATFGDVTPGLPAGSPTSPATDPGSTTYGFLAIRPGTTVVSVTADPTVNPGATGVTFNATVTPTVSV